MKFIDTLFAPVAEDQDFRVPITAYQDYCQRRYKVDTGLDLDSDIGRFRGLIWYIENYCTHRGRLQAPLSGEQIRFLNEESAAGLEPHSLPRIVEYYWRRSLSRFGNPFLDGEDYLKIAFWWCAEKAPEMGVERTLVGEQMIEALSRRVPSARGGAGPSEYLLRRAEQSSTRWSFDSEAERLAAYIDVLFEPMGLYNALFFPLDVLDRLLNFGGDFQKRRDLDADEVRLDRFVAVRNRAAAALAYRKTHLENSSGGRDVAASTIDRPWYKASACQGSPNGAAALEGLPLRVIGPLHSQSGLGQATRLSLKALRSAGLEVQTLDFHLDNPAAREIQYPDSICVSDQPSINLIHLNAESIPLAAAYLDQRLFQRSYNIGYFFWELPQPAHCHELALRQLDEIWVSSAFNETTYAHRSEAVVTRVGMAVEAPDTSDLTDRSAVRRRFGIPPQAIAFLTTFDAFSFMSRKNPHGTIRAFLKAFPKGDEPVSLIVKTHNLYALLGETRADHLRRAVLSLIAQDRRVVLINETLSHAELLSLKAACDCYVSLHRSEGWGFGALESMQLKLPVIATSFSGNIDFCNADTAFNVSYTKTYLGQDDYIFVRPGDYWAEPDLDEAAAFMRRVVADPAAARQLGERAYNFVQKNFSIGAVGARYLDRLKIIEAAAHTWSNPLE